MSKPQVDRMAVMGCLAALFVALAIEVWSQRSLEADGVNFFVRMLMPQWFSTWDFPRQNAHYLTQWPLIVGMRLFHVTNFWLLSSLYGFGMYSKPFDPAQPSEWPDLSAFGLWYTVFSAEK